MDPCLGLMDPDQDPAIFVSDLQKANKKLFFHEVFLLIRYFLKVHLHHFSKIKCPKEVTKQEESRFSYYLAWWWKDPDPYRTSDKWIRKAQNMWIRWIRNTGCTVGRQMAWPTCCIVVGPFGRTPSLLGRGCVGGGGGGVTTGFTAGVSGRGAAAAAFTGSFHQQSHVHTVQSQNVNLKVPKCEISISRIRMIFMSFLQMC